MVTEHLQGLPLWVLGMVQRLRMLRLDLWGLLGLGKVSGSLLGMVVVRGLALRLEVESGMVRYGVRFAGV